MIKLERFLPCSSLTVLEKLTLVFSQVLFSQTKWPPKIPHNVFPTSRKTYLPRSKKKPPFSKISPPSFLVFLPFPCFCLLPQATTRSTMHHSANMSPSPTTIMGELLMFTTRPCMELHGRCPPLPMKCSPTS